MSSVLILGSFSEAVLVHFFTTTFSESASNRVYFIDVIEKMSKMYGFFFSNLAVL